VRKGYQRDNGEAICFEVCRITILVREAGYLLTWDSTFSGDRTFYFGDQEEMGLGLRVATPISVVEGGELLDAEGRRNERNIWGNTSAWCDYRGELDGQLVGILLMSHPGNFRKSWLHARDYGFVAANPFGRSAFRKGPPSKVVIEPGNELQLRYGLLVHAGPKDSPPDFNAVYDDYLMLTAGTASGRQE
jgi:hypothetical protein